MEVGCDLGRCRLEGSGEVWWGGEVDGECEREASESGWGDGGQSRDIASGKSLYSSELWQFWWCGSRRTIVREGRVAD